MVEPHVPALLEDAFGPLALFDRLIEHPVEAGDAPLHSFSAVIRANHLPRSATQSPIVAAGSALTRDDAARQAIYNACAEYSLAHAVASLEAGVRVIPAIELGALEERSVPADVFCEIVRSSGDGICVNRRLIGVGASAIAATCAALYESLSAAALTRPNTSAARIVELGAFLSEPPFSRHFESTVETKISVVEVHTGTRIHMVRCEVSWAGDLRRHAGVACGLSAHLATVAAATRALHAFNMARVAPNAGLLSPNYDPPRRSLRPDGLSLSINAGGEPGISMESADELRQIVREMKGDSPLVVVEITPDDVRQLGLWVVAVLRGSLRDPQMRPSA